MVIFDKTADEVQKQEDAIIGIMEDRMGLIVGVERLSPRQFTKDNVTIESDPTGTDIWFYAIDPETERILDRNSTRIKRLAFIVLLIFLFYEL